MRTQYHPDESELFYRTLELVQISGDEYVSFVLREDLTGILRDIRKARPECARDKTTASPFDAIEKFRKNVQSVMEGKGSRAEQVAKAYLTAFGIDYDRLAPEEFVVLIVILQKS